MVIALLLAALIENQWEIVNERDKLTDKYKYEYTIVAKGDKGNHYQFKLKCTDEKYYLSQIATFRNNKPHNIPFETYYIGCGIHGGRCEPGFPVIEERTNRTFRYRVDDREVGTALLESTHSNAGDWVIPWDIVLNSVLWRLLFADIHPGETVEFKTTFMRMIDENCFAWRKRDILEHMKKNKLTK